MDIKKIEFKLQEIFPKYNIIISYLFGSVASGNTTSLSDIDIAVLLPDNLKKEEMFIIKLKLMNELSSSLKTEKIDVVILNSASTLLKFSVVKNGIGIFNPNKYKRIEFETSVRRDYFDMVKFYDIRNQYLIRKIKENQYGCRPCDYSKASAKIRRLHKNLTRISDSSA
ncbi:MAG: nucleotidyltransferase domain-containing protein [Candidatus Omnitrophica bacterium]|nr:nucleotidyltransferase domain-containing protein [Candidatus Omnitrophota bacterium]MCK5492783.1 nucleotidyltransferase domain-containing protein [Candidatus Omnitrophota bacterium]